MHRWLQNTFARCLRHYSRRWRLNTAAFVLATAYASGGGLLNATVLSAGLAYGNVQSGPPQAALLIQNELARLNATRDAIGSELNAIDELLAQDSPYQVNIATAMSVDQLLEIQNELEAIARNGRALYQAEAELLAEAWQRSEPAALSQSSGSRSLVGVAHPGQFSTLPRGESLLAVLTRAKLLTDSFAPESAGEHGRVAWCEDQRRSLHLHSIRNGAVGGDALVTSNSLPPFAFRISAATRFSSVLFTSLSFRSVLSRAISRASIARAFVAGTRSTMTMPRLRVVAIFASYPGEFV